MTQSFYVAATIAVFCTLRAITQMNAIRALLYLVVSFLAIAVIFFFLGAPFAAALEIIIYAGAIMVLFVFAMMILNLGPISEKHERSWVTPRMWIEPVILAAVLVAELFEGIAKGVNSVSPTSAIQSVDPAAVGQALLNVYPIGIELASTLLLAGLVGAYHLGYRRMVAVQRQEAGPVRAREAA